MFPAPPPLLPRVTETVSPGSKRSKYQFTQTSEMLENELPKETVVLSDELGVIVVGAVGASVCALNVSTACEIAGTRARAGFRPGRRNGMTLPTVNPVTWGAAELFCA